MTPVIALTTVASAEEAQRIAHDLVQRRLVACVNIVDEVRSIYRWRGEIRNEPELILIMKTIAEKIEELRQHLSSIHPYEVPEFVVLRIDDISATYREWLEESTR